MARVTSSSSRRAATQTALDVLKADHEEVSKLFKQFEKFKKSDDSDGMQQVARTACKARAWRASYAT